MLLLLTCLLAAASAAPTLLDQSQSGGGSNYQADLKNIFIVVGLPKKAYDIVDMFLKESKSNELRSNEVAQDRSDIHAMEAFVEPNKPYRVEIGNERSAGGSIAAEEVEIPGRRRLEVDAQPHDEMKLIGATEQCGPDRERDPVTLICRFRVDVIPEKAPEVVPST